MSGHNRWSQIRHKKAVTDKKRAQIFSRISRLITLAARKGADPKTNSSLAQIIERARSQDMPLDNIQRAIKKVSEKTMNGLETLTVEAVGPGGSAMKITAVTDNKNRTIAEIRKILIENDSKMVQPGSIDWMFDQPDIKLNGSGQDKMDKLMGILDEHDDVEDVITNIL